MLMLFLFPIGLGAAMVALVADAVRFGSVWRVRTGIVLICAALIVSYGVAFTVLALDPYFEDNGSPARIDARHLWIWALELAGWLALAIVPIMFALRARLQRAMAVLRRRAG
jgi:uncharacterized membrane protein YkvI